LLPVDRDTSDDVATGRVHGRLGYELRPVEASFLPQVFPFGSLAVTSLAVHQFLIVTPGTTLPQIGVAPF
jgi:hypothetical protein